ncbi:MAG: SDR family NAD(P)-dependent oxidoreductase [Clostridia bacterium]|nr:SDR family NAD(P)-dependent oxidoreductase [Clostridia bacterium]
MATALITGASSGMGRDMAVLLAEKGFNLILVARNEAELKKAAEGISTQVTIIPMDLSIRKNCYKLHSIAKNIDILINNAGFGAWGEFYYSDLKNELNMIDLNISALHILTKLYLRDFVRKNKGYILNVASLASFGSGPLMATYYATKAYVYKLTTAINEELRQRRSRVHISVFCPGPVDTGFNDRANVSFAIKPLDSMEAAKKALRGMFWRKTVIIPGFSNRLTMLLCKVVPLRLVLITCFHIQRGKSK